MLQAPSPADCIKAPLRKRERITLWARLLARSSAARLTAKCSSAVVGSRCCIPCSRQRRRQPPWGCRGGAGPCAVPATGVTA